MSRRQREQHPQGEGHGQKHGCVVQRISRNHARCNACLSSACPTLPSPLRRNLPRQVCGAERAGERSQCERHEQHSRECSRTVDHCARHYRLRRPVRAHKPCARHAPVSCVAVLRLRGAGVSRGANSERVECCRRRGGVRGHCHPVHPQPATAPVACVLRGHGGRSRVGGGVRQAGGEEVGGVEAHDHRRVPRHHAGCASGRPTERPAGRSQRRGVRARGGAQRVRHGSCACAARGGATAQRLRAGTGCKAAQPSTCLATAQ